MLPIAICLFTLVTAATPPASCQEASMPSTAAARTSSPTDAADCEAIRAAVLTIATGADRRDWDAVRAAFAPSVVLDYGTPETLTPDQVVARWRPLLEAFDATQHQLSHVEVTVAGDEATVTSRFLATHVLAGADVGGDVWSLEGRYEHALARTADGRWVVTRMRMIPGASTGNARLLEVARARAAAATGARP